MSEFNKDDYLNDLPDADELAAGQVALRGRRSGGTRIEQRCAVR